MTENTPGSHHTTTPLGGSTRRTAFPLIDHRRGFVAMVRRCPACGHENSSESLFCSDCGQDIRDLAPDPSTADRPGLEVIRARIRRDKRRERRVLEQEGAGGSGWLLLSPFLILPAIALPNDSPVRYGLWLLGMVAALTGLWQIRQNSSAIRGWGIFLGIVTIITFLNFGVQAYDNRDSGVSRAIVATPGASAIAASNPATITAGKPGAITTDVLAFRGDSSHSGRQPGPAPAGNPVLAWRFDTGGEVYSTPVIANGVLYTASKGGALYALDATTGTLKWKFQLSAYAVRSSPAVANGVVYIGGGFSLFAIDAATGKQRWKADMRYAGQSTPVIANGVVIAPSQEGWIYGFDATTGAQQWRILTDGVVFGAAAIDGGNAVFGTDKGTVYSVSVTTGDVGWQKSMPAGVVATPTAVGDKIFISLESGQTVGVDAKTGATLWTAQIGGVQPSGALDSLLVIASSDGGIHAVDQGTGNDAWLYPTGKQAIAAPATTGNQVIVGAGNTLLNLDGTTGKLDGYYLANGPIETSPVVVDGYIFFGSEDGFIYALKSQ